MPRFGRFNRFNRGAVRKEKLKYYQKKYKEEIQWLIDNKNIVKLNFFLQSVSDILLTGAGDFTEKMKKNLHEVMHEIEHEIDEDVDTERFLLRIESLLKSIESIKSYRNLRFTKSYYDYSDYVYQIHKSVTELKKIKKSQLEMVDKIEKEYARRIKALDKMESIRKNKKKA